MGATTYSLSSPRQTPQSRSSEGAGGSTAGDDTIIIPPLPRESRESDPIFLEILLHTVCFPGRSRRQIPDEHPTERISEAHKQEERAPVAAFEREIGSNRAEDHQGIIILADGHYHRLAFLGHVDPEDNVALKLLHSGVPRVTHQDADLIFSQLLPSCKGSIYYRPANKEDGRAPHSY